MSVELPFDPRPGQLELISSIQAAQGRRGHVVVEAATGTGKTISALVASLRSIEGTEDKVIYATRTNSQQTQIVAEHHRLRMDGQDPGLLIPFMGRRHYCPLLANDERYSNGTAEELGKLCSDAKRKAIQELETGRPVEGACPYFRKLQEDGTYPIEGLLRMGLDARGLAARIADVGSCPYEALKALLPRADVIAVPTVFVVDDALRNALSAWIGLEATHLHVVVDEAHNFPTTAQEHHSPQLGAATIQRAIHEAEAVQDPVLAGRVLTSSFLHALESGLLALADEFVLNGADDALVPGGSLEEHIMESLKVPSTVIVQAAADMETWGEIIREKKRAMGRLPRSYLGAVGSFLHAWWGSRDAPYAHLIQRNPLQIEAFLLDPGHVLGWMDQCASTAHMSGTLAPLDEYVSVCRMPPETVSAQFASPFHPDNLRVTGFHGLHRRWKEHMEDPNHAIRQQDACREILAKVSGRTALWFPSHAMLRDYVEEGLLHEVGRPIHAERPELSMGEAVALVEKFKKSPNGLLLGVLGGRLSEGIDFPGDALENAIVFGIPYPKPTARLHALIHHHDRAHDGQGWTFAVHNPVGRRIRQAIGRLIRGPDDSGHAFILDERIARFRSHLDGLEMVETVAEAMGPRHVELGFRTARRPSLENQKS